MLAGSPEACADRVLRLMADPAARDRMGEKGREHVRRNFLTTRLLRDYLELFEELRTKG